MWLHVFIRVFGCYYCCYCCCRVFLWLDTTGTVLLAIIHTRCNCTNRYASIKSEKSRHRINASAGAATLNCNIELRCNSINISEFVTFAGSSDCRSHVVGTRLYWWLYCIVQRLWCNFVGCTNCDNSLPLLVILLFSKWNSFGPSTILASFNQNHHLKFLERLGTEWAHSHSVQSLSLCKVRPYRWIGCLSDRNKFFSLSPLLLYWMLIVFRVWPLHV